MKYRTISVEHSTHFGWKGSDVRFLQEIMKIDRRDPNVVREMGNNPSRSVAVVGLLDPNNNILLVRTTRFPDHWQPIGGGMDRTDSSPIETILRELKEETSLQLPREAFHFVLSTDYDFGNGKVYFYTAKVPGTLHIEFNPSEVVETRWDSLRSAQSLKVFPATKTFLSYLLNETR